MEERLSYQYYWSNVIAGIFVILVSLTINATPSMALTESKDIPGEGASAGADTLTFLSSELLPFAALRDGKPVGFAVEILHEIMLRLERSDTIEFDDWDIVYKRTLTEPDTVLLPPSRTVEREKLFKWVGPLIPEKIVLFARKDSGLVIKSPEDAKKVRAIATVTGYASEKLLKAMGFTNLASQRSPLQGPDALKSGRVDLWLNSNITMRETALAANVDPDLFEPVFVFKEIPSYLAFSKSVSDDLVNQWQTALDDMKMDGSWERIVSGWIPADLLRIGSAPPQSAMEPFLALSNVILACILSIAIFNFKTRGHNWLSLLLLCWAAHSLLRWGLFTGNHFVMVYFPVISLPALCFFGSTILLYTDTVLFDKKPKVRWHLIVPGIVSLVHVTILFVVPEQMTVSHIKNQEGIHKAYTTSLVIGLGIYVITFGWIAFYRIITYKNMFKDNFSNDMIRNIRWLFTFVLANLGILMFAIITATYYFIKDMGVPFTFVEDIVVLFILLFFIYYLITKPEVLPVEFVATEKSGEKYAKVNLPDETRRDYAKKLENFMVQKQAFLDENISVRQIADELNIPRHHISMTINIEFDLNFYNYVNRYRIRYAQDLLKDTEESDESILMIAYRSGFQSKTSFNKAFKATNEMTPTEYRKIHSPKIP